MVLLCTNRRHVELGAAGIVVKVLNKQLKEGKYYKKKALVLAVVDRSRARPPLCMCATHASRAWYTRALFVRGFHARACAHASCAHVRVLAVACVVGGLGRGLVATRRTEKHALPLCAGVGGSVGGWVGGACNLYGWSTQVLSPA